MLWLFAASRRFFLCVYLVMLSVSTSFADDVTLTLEDAQRRAIIYSRQLAGQDFSILAMREMVVTARQLPDPILKIGVDNFPIQGSHGFSLTNDSLTMRRIAITQELASAEKRQLRSDRWLREVEKTIAEKNIKIAAIERDTALAWFELYYAKAMDAVLTEQSTQAQFEIEAAEIAYRARRGSQASIFSARNALLLLEDRSSEMKTRIRQAETQLVRWTGVRPPITLVGESKFDQFRWANHPEINVLDKAEEIATIEVKLAQANKKPDWNVELAYQQRGPAYDNLVSIGVSIPLQWNRKNLQDRELTAKLTLVEQVKAQREETLRMYSAETRNMTLAWQNARQRHTRYTNELLPLAKARTAAILAAYRGGKAELIEVLEAQRNESELRLQALQLEADTARWWAQLNFLEPSPANAVTSSDNGS